MGLLTDLLLLPVTGPYHGLRFILEQIREEAITEQFDERGIQAELMALGLRLDQGEIPEDIYLEQEAALLQRLNQARALRTQQADGLDADEVDADDQDARSTVQRAQMGAGLDAWPGGEGPGT